MDNQQRHRRGIEPKILNRAVKLREDDLVSFSCISYSQRVMSVGNQLLYRRKVTNLVEGIMMVTLCTVMAKMTL